MSDFISGVIKGAVFGLIIGVVGCFKGLTVEGGTEGVGRATTADGGHHLRHRLPGRLLHHQAHPLPLAHAPVRPCPAQFHPPTPGEELIRFEHLQKSFGPKRVYDDLELSVPAGETLASSAARARARACCSSASSACCSRTRAASSSRGRT